MKHEKLWNLVLRIKMIKLFGKFKELTKLIILALLIFPGIYILLLLFVYFLYGEDAFH